MKTALLTAMALVVLLGGGSLRTQDLSTTILPSEDEIIQALRSGEITYEQYVILLEIAVNGLDSSNIHLLDQIPNLGFFGLDSNSLASQLEQEQQIAFATDSASTAREPGIVIGRLRHSYYRYIEEFSGYNSQTKLDLRLRDRIYADLAFRRDYYDEEEILLSRSLSYRNPKSTVREILVGSFSRRFGMGTVYGYRGRLLSSSDGIDRESLMFPDYGGSNGGLVRVAAGGVDVQTVASVVRDDLFRLSSGASIVQFEQLPLKPSLLFGVNNLKNRETGESIDDLKYGLNVAHRYKRGRVGAEFVWQDGARSSPGAFVIEGRHRLHQAEIKYALWAYSDEFIDLSSGSKAAGLRHRDTLDEVAFQYNTKRSGQEGAMVKTVVDLSSRLEFANSALYASFNSDTINTQWLSELNLKLNRLTLSGNFLTKTQHRVGSSSGTDVTHRQTRLVARYKTDRLYFRSHIGYDTETGEPGYVSLFTMLKYEFKSYIRVELWTNLTRIDLSEGRTNNWYAYVKNSFRVAGGLSVGAKVMHRYYRNYLDRHRTQILLDLVYLWG
ncbi:MAG: hypothetical protein AB1483_04760 [Candidatus Zixiibacteriota bacterium]